MTQTDASAAFFAARDQLLACAGDPARARAEFSWPDVGDAFNWAHDVFDVIAEGNDTVALWISEEDGREQKLTFAELKRRSDQVANWLRATGLRRGDVAMLMLGNRVELWEIMLAAMKLGVVILPTSVVLGAAELVDRVERGRVTWVFAAPEDAIKFGDVPGRYRGVGVGLADGTKDQRSALWEWAPYEESRAAGTAAIPKLTRSIDPALIYFTSGTTSLPKIVVHSHTSYPLGHLTTMSWLGVRPGDTHLVISAPGWAKHAWSSFFGPWHVGATIFVANYARFDAEFLVSELDRAGVTTFCAPPTVWRMLIQHRLDRKPRALREVVSAGEPLNPEVIARIQEWWGLEIRDGYGQTETTALIGNMPGDPIVPGAMGLPLPGVDAVLVDPLTGEEAREGEICLRIVPADPERDGDAPRHAPRNLMTGYFGNDEATARATAGGLFHTGDVAQRGDDGVLTFVGRTDDVFKSSDFKVSPFEVESALLEHPAVAEAAVVGAPDETKLNVTKAYVALAAGVPATQDTAREVLAHARVALPPYMRVRRVEFFELPKTTSGKIRRVELRDREVVAYDAGERLPEEWREEDFPGLKG
ncbi:AMP-binding protein [Leucobacter chromiireducens]|uniref:AMP-dependent synthetase n=1 Tax=Leucobacter chromiireducens subsp. solipictus TaxID=398235 RepID=A0ABS1SDE7_9MICO|nr:AMP-binding protein [Leucobacter chromiireducens]MBL3678567.1 AMP-dependent synthetase [Leucobacter chromiireducens subsp. solipictus]